MAIEYAIRNKATGEIGPPVGMGDSAKVGALAGLQMAANPALELVSREVGDWHSESGTWAEPSLDSLLGICSD